MKYINDSQVLTFVQEIKLFKASSRLYMWKLHCICVGNCSCRIARFNHVLYGPAVCIRCVCIGSVRTASIAFASVASTRIGCVRTHQLHPHASEQSCLSFQIRCSSSILSSGMLYISDRHSFSHCHRGSFKQNYYKPIKIEQNFYKTK